MTDFRKTAEAIRILRLTVWDLDGCYALDRLHDAAMSLHSARQYVDAEPRRLEKLDKHLRRLAIEAASQFPAEPPTPREIEVMEIDARSKARREEMRDA